MKISKLQLILAGIAFYLVLLIANLPASQVISRITLPNGLSVSGVSGTIWNGRADVISFREFSVFNARWELGFFSLLLGKAAIDVDAGSQRDAGQISVAGEITVSQSSIEASNLVAYAPANSVIPYAPIPVPVAASGRIKVELREATFNQNCQSITGTGTWINAAVDGLSGKIDLGNFESALSCEEKHVVVTVEKANSLGLTVNAKLAPNGRLKADGRFKLPADAHQEIRTVAQFFNEIDSEGYRIIRIPR